MKTSIEIKNIHHRYKFEEILKGINLTIEEGEIFGLLGPTGAGKTTLLKILTGQLAQSQGEALVHGKDTRRLKLSDYEAFGMVLDTVGIYDRLSCYDNLHLFTKIYGIKSSIIDEVLTRVGLGEAKKTLGMNLSKGMRQRLALARALVHKPTILFLDEPTSGLDPATVVEIHRLLEEVRAEGVTIFLTTHNMAEATKLCDHVAMLNKGEIVEYGPPREVCQRYNHQNKIDLQLHSGQRIDIINSPESADLIRDYFRNGQVKAIHSTEPNLETVFVELTGRRFE